MRAAVTEADNWVSAWYAAPTRMLPANICGRTLRQRVHPKVGGRRIRVHVSNRYGDEPIEVMSASVAPAPSWPFTRSESSAVLFDGQATLVLPPGQDVVSDPAVFSVEAFADLTVTWFLAAGEPVTGHSSRVQTSLLSGLGDVTVASDPVDFLRYPLQVSGSWLLTGVDVDSTSPVNALVAFGSSTTQGAGSTVDAHRSWPDQLARRLSTAHRDRFMSVVNAGIGGNQLTTADRPVWVPPDVPLFMMGEGGETRLAWDALMQCGATDLIVNIGSNDLRNGVAAAAIVESYRRLVTMARGTFARVFGSTIMPGGYTAETAAQRRLVNAWLRKEDGKLFDAVFEFATPLSASDNEDVLHSDYDSGDGIHPNDNGYRVVAESVDESLLSGSPDY